MRKTTTVYLCDGCGSQVGRAKELRSFDVNKSHHYEYVIRTELCIECEPKFLSAVSKFVKDEDVDRVHGMGRTKNG